MITRNTGIKNQTDIEAEKPILPISIVAEMLQVHQRTLRIYDEEKLLSPKRTPKNRRLYSLNDIERGKFIQYLTRELGINLIGVKIIFQLLKDTDINSDKYAEYINGIAHSLNITEEIQIENRKKFSKRGRHKIIE